MGVLTFSFCCVFFIFVFAVCVCFFFFVRVLSPFTLFSLLVFSMLGVIFYLFVFSISVRSIFCCCLNSLSVFS